MAMKWGRGKRGCRILVSTNLSSPSFALRLIIRDVASVLSAIRLDHRTVLMTAEIGDEATDCAGALTAIAKVVARVRLQFSFSAGWILAQSRHIDEQSNRDQAAATALGHISLPAPPS
jgi:hypothetical protein